MRVDVKKFLFIGPTADKEHFFNEAQKAGIVEFINPKGQRHIPHSQEVDDYLHSMKILRGYVQEKQEIKKDLNIAKEICNQVLHTKQLLDQAEEGRHKLEQEIELIAPFGNFSIEDLTNIEKETAQKIRFYCAKSIKEYEKSNEYLILINSVDGIDYFITITDNKNNIQNLVQDLLEVTISESLTTLKQKLITIKQTIGIQEERLKLLTRYNWLLHYALVEKLNQLHLCFAQTSTTAALEDTLFTIEGWVPKNKIEALYLLINRLNIFSEEVLLEGNESVPTYLENEGVHRVGEDIIHIFDVPSTQDKDPSMWVLCAFALFFAMIVGDAGYGLIFLLTAVVIQYKIKGLKGLSKRLVKLTAILGVSCLLWGLLINSFFSINFAESNPLRSYSLLNWLIEKKADYHLQHHDDVYQFWVEKIPALTESKTGKEFIKIGNEAKISEHPSEKFTNNILMELALFVGSIHVILGLARYIRKNPIGAGWIAFIIGAYLYLPLYLQAASLVNFAFGIDQAKAAEFGLQLLCFGALFSVVAAIFKSGFLGIFEIMTSVQILGDILSYLRIYALALAGAIVSATINSMAGELPLFIAVILIIFAHVLNIILSIMGGVIHGLRLNFLEWYHYSFEGGGRKFMPLELHIFD